jgi:hypothetical protein
MDLLKAFLGNGSVNTFQRATVGDVSSSLLGSSQHANVVLPVQSLYNEDLLWLRLVKSPGEFLA